MKCVMDNDMAISIIVGNWKMNTTITEAKKLALEIENGLTHVPGVEAVVCPPFVSLNMIHSQLKNSCISIGAQNAYHKSSGAYTGEVSMDMLINICKYVIVGHSERRSLFGETDETVNLKVNTALRAGITPIICVGENLEERESGRAESVVGSQIRAGLREVCMDAGIVVAYEPVWAIGSGKSASPEIAQTMMAHIREALADIGGSDIASKAPLLYGGSVNADNIGGFIKQEDINGALIGGASLDAKSFIEIVKAAGQN